MQQLTKRKIAKEIIIFFSSIILIGLVWTTFWVVNYTNINKSENINKQIDLATNNIDSIQSFFFKLITFRTLISGNVPAEILNILPPPPDGFPLPPPPDGFRPPPPDGFLGAEQQQQHYENLRQLFSVLIKAKYQFLEDSLSIDFTIFKWEIISELTMDSSKQHSLINIYSFLKNQKYLKAEYKEFIFSLGALPQLPKGFTFSLDELPQHPISPTMIFYKDEIINRAKLETELNVVEARVYSPNELNVIAIWFSIIVFSIVYPLRFLIILLSWSIRTLKQK